MRNPTYEQALTNQGVEWEYAERIALVDVDRDKGLRNQARLEMPLDEELVNAYAAAMQRGDQFPPVVLWRPGRGRWQPIDGNQRLAGAAKIGRKEVDAYVVRTADPMLADRLTWTFNNLVNGKRLSTEEALRHAVTFCRKYGMSQAEAAKEWGLSEYQVRNAVRVLSLREVLEEKEIRGVKTLTDDKLLRMAPLEAAGHDVLALGAAAVIENGMTTDQILEMTKRVGAAKTQQAKLEAVVAYTRTEEVKVRKAETRGGRVDAKPLPRQKAADLLERLWRMCEDFPAPALRPGGKQQFKELREKWLAVALRMTEVYGTGAVVPKEDVG